MINKCMLYLLMIPVICYSQQKSSGKLPVIRAGSEMVDIKEGNVMKKRVWRIMPAQRPDILITSSKKVTFYTDMDSISFNIKPKVGIYDFVILLNGKDSAFTRIQYQPSYLGKLQQAEKYNYKDTRFIPRFTYQPVSDPDLVRTREVLKLDSVAGQGNEISKIINLMYWVHDMVRHDGNSYNPGQRNAVDLISICKKEGRGVNCRMMATILNECYLAMGIKSRFITCMPRETEFTDCHVINMVYSNELGKWVWMDPTFCAYVMNEKGELLGPAEVRERLISGKTLILNPDANWNRQASQTKENYLDNYMAKNLYRINSLAASEYDAETRGTPKEVSYVELLPLDGIVQEPQKDVKVQDNFSTTFYKTNNPGLFWAKPE